MKEDWMKDWMKDAVMFDYGLSLCLRMIAL